MGFISKRQQYRYHFIVNAIGIAVAFTMNFPEFIEIVISSTQGPHDALRIMYPDLSWTQVASEILFTYISILVLFFVNEKLFRFNSADSEIGGKKILLSFLITWIINGLLEDGFILLHKHAGIPLIESMMHVYTHPLRDILISAIVTAGGYLIHQDLVSRKVVMENQQLKTENIKNQFEALKNQLNPHMLFNSLNTLYSLIREDPDKAQEYLSRLSKVIRFSLMQDEEKDSNTIYLNEELEYLESYIYLIKMRYEENLDIHIDIDDSLLGRKIPKMSLQLLVENAVKHNEISNRHPLHVDIVSTDDGEIRVSNNLQLRRDSVSGTGIGLDNLSKRYRLLMGRDIDIRESDGLFVVTIPLN